MRCLRPKGAQGVRGSTTPTLPGGTSSSPVDPLGATSSPLHCDQRSLSALLWTPSSKGHCVAPCNPCPRTFASLDPRPVFDTGFDQSGDVSSPFGNPSTSALKHVGLRAGPARNRRGNVACWPPTVCPMARKKRGAPFSYRPTVAQRDAVVAAWKASGFSFSAFVTASILGKVVSHARRVSPIDHKMAAMLLSQAARIADRLGEAKPGCPVHAGLLQEARAELVEIRAALLVLLGREP